MLDQELTAQLQNYMNMLRRPVVLTATLGDDAQSQKMLSLLEQIAAMSAHISLHTNGTSARVPSFKIERPDATQHLEFAAIPLGHEFTSLVLALLWSGGHPPKVEADTITRIQNLSGDFDFEVFMSLSCQSCPDTVQALTLMATHNPQVKVSVIDGALFQSEVDARQIMAVPMVFANGELLGNGRMSADDILNKIDTSNAQAAKLNDKKPYDVLVVGGGPAGSAAAIYAARKGIRTAMLAERLGGQVQDTLSIENLISVKATQGPKLAADLLDHVRQYDIDVISAHAATQLTPPNPTQGSLAQVELASGATLQARAVIITTGARWREMGIAGEAEYKTRGVAFCPHCDGPLFKGKKVAVIGGGNSGVEAAIDLAGIVEHVTVLEFMPELKADAVLQKKLHSLSNVQVLTNVQTTEVVGDGKRVTALRYKNRDDDANSEIELAGIFVQIGLQPNTDWLQDTVERNRYGEIIITQNGNTSATGVFAAGDCTNVKHKQIIVAMGEGAKAALSAFEYLITH